MHPIVAMLLALIFRGVAFEFRWRDPGHRPWWDIAFSLGSIVAAFAQGVTLGALLQGIAVENRVYAGGWFDWLTPFSALVGVCLIVGYALLGATWLIMKSEGTLQVRCYRMAFGLGIGTIVAIAAVSAGDAVPERRLLAALVRLAAGAVHRAGAAAGDDRRGGLFREPDAPASLHAVPDDPADLHPEPGRARHQPVPLCRAAQDTIWDAAAPAASLKFMLPGALVMVPIILAYTGYSYWVFRGKTGHEGYH
jgi:cytochrome d ubiquinol oxidase subunit II